MAKNKPYGDGHRIGAIIGEFQVKNPITKLWVKFKKEKDGSVAIVDNKTTGGSFKGVTHRR